MVDFGDTIFDGKLSPSSALVEPVQNKSGEAFLTGLSNGLNDFGAFLTADRKSKADSQKNALFAEISDTMNLYADAREQGMSTDEIMRNIRVKANEWVSNYPALTEDIHTFIGKTLSDNGLASNITKETPEEARARKLADDAYNEGWGTNIGAYQRFKALEASNKVTQAEIDATLADGKKLTAVQQARATRDLHELVAVGLPWVQQQLSDSMNLLSNTTDPGERQAIIDKTKQTINTRVALINESRSLSGNAVDTSYLTSGIDTLVTQWEKTASGQSTSEAWKNAYELSQNKANAMINMDPKIAQLYAMNKASNFMSTSIMTALNDEQNKMVAQLGITDADTTGVKVPDLVGKTEEIIPVTDAVKDEIKNINNSSEADKSVIDDATTHIKNVMKSVSRNGAGETDPRNFNAVIDLLADPQIGAFIEKNGNGAFKDVGKEASDIVDRQYLSVLLPLINQRWSTASTELIKGINVDVSPWEVPVPISDIQRLDIKDIINPTWNGVGIEFVVDDRWKNNERVRNIAKDLNKDVATVLNKTVKASAHLSGTTDYKSVYDNSYAKYLWVKGDQPKPTMDQMTGRDLTNGTSLKELSDLPKAVQKVSQELNQAFGDGANDTYTVAGNVIAAGKGYTTITTPDGKTVKRTGVRNWRNNNPGNIEYGDFAKSQGAVGSDGRFAVFPTLQDGENAQAKLIFESPSYKDLSLAAALHRYAPLSDGNDTYAYIDTVAKIAGVDPYTIMSEIPEDKRKLVLKAMQRVEGFKPGKEDILS